MKHIEKKYLNQKLLTEEEKNQLSAKVMPYDDRVNNVKFDSSKQVAFVVSENDYVVQAFQFRENGKTRFIPEPDQVLIYFNSAYNCWKQISVLKTSLLDKTEPAGQMNEGTENEIYNLFGQTSGFIIFLFSAIEAFLNRMIPNEFEYKEERKNRTEVYDKFQIQRHLSFDVKYSKILPEITGKDFKTNFPQKHTILWNLKEFRDDLIHPKQDQAHNSYEQISKKALKFKFEKTLEVVRDYLNYYQTDLIVECKCGHDF